MKFLPKLRACATTFFFVQTICSAVMAEPTRIFRVTPQFSEWLSESDVIVKCFLEELKVPAESKIVPLFITVRLGLFGPIGENGPTVDEYAFIYSETPRQDASLEKKITVFVRSPYQNRKWRTEEMVNIVEQGDSLVSVLKLDDKLDLYKQVSSYSKKINAPISSNFHTIKLQEVEVLAACRIQIHFGP